MGLIIPFHHYFWQVMPLQFCVQKSPKMMTCHTWEQQLHLPQTAVFWDLNGVDIPLPPFWNTQHSLILTIQILILMTCLQQKPQCILQSWMWAKQYQEPALFVICLYPQEWLCTDIYSLFIPMTNYSPTRIVAQHIIISRSSAHIAQTFIVLQWFYIQNVTIHQSWRHRWDNMSGDTQ